MIETLVRCFRPLSAPLKRRWATIATVHAASALTELGAAAALYAFLGGTARSTWLIEIIQRPGQDPFLTGLIAVVTFLIAKSLLAAVATWLRAGTTADSIQESFTSLVRADLRRDVFLHGDDTGSSRLIWRAMRVSDVAYRIVAAAGVSVLAESFAVIALATAMIVIAPLPAVVAAIVVGFAGGGLLVATRNVTSRVGGESHQRSGDLASAMHSVFAVHREIRSKQREHAFTDSLSRVHEKRLPSFRQHLVLLMLPRHMVEISFALILLAVVLVTRAGVTQAEFIPILGVFAYSGFRLVPAANRILFSIDEIRHHRDAVRQLEEGLVDEPPQEGDAAFGAIRATIREHRYKPESSPALSSLDLSIRPGERIGIIGESGSGKSTLLDLLGGLVRPTEGSVSIGAQPAHAWLRSGGRLGYVPQGSLLLDATILENIAFGSSSPRELIDAAIEITCLKDTIEGLPEGLNTLVGERGGRLSGGERQRVTIARAIVDRPELLLLDEATSALDQPTELRVLSSLSARPGLTIVAAAHRPRSLSFCDRILVLNRGRLVAMGTIDELHRASEEFRRLSLEEDRENSLPSNA